MWQRQELICDYFAGLVYSCFIHSWGNWDFHRKGGLRRQLRNSNQKQNSNFSIIDISAKLITNHTYNSDLRIITEYKLAMKKILFFLFLELKQHWMYHDQKKKVFWLELQEFRKNCRKHRETLLRGECSNWMCFVIWKLAPENRREEESSDYQKLYLLPAQKYNFLISY